MSNLEIYRNDFPALNHEIVKEGHIKACHEFGCAYHTVDGVADPRCPRCGDLTQRYIDDNGLTETEIRSHNNPYPPARPFFPKRALS